MRQPQMEGQLIDPSEEDWIIIGPLNSTDKAKNTRRSIESRGGMIVEAKNSLKRDACCRLYQILQAITCKNLPKYRCTIAFLSGGWRCAMIAYLVVIRHERSSPLIGTKDLQSEDGRREHVNWLAVGYLLSLKRSTRIPLSAHACCRYTAPEVCNSHTPATGV